MAGNGQSMYRPKDISTEFITEKSEEDWDIPDIWSPAQLADL